MISYLLLSERKKYLIVNYTSTRLLFNCWLKNFGDLNYKLMVQTLEVAKVFHQLCSFIKGVNKIKIY